MNTQSVSIDELRTNLAELIGRVMYGNDKIVIKKYNRDAAVLVSVDEYEKLLDPTKRFTKSQWEEKFKLIDEIKERIPERDQELLEQEIDKAVREIRAKKKKAPTKKVNAGNWLLEMAEEAERLGAKGPKDLASNVDKYLYGKK